MSMEPFTGSILVNKKNGKYLITYKILKLAFCKCLWCEIINKIIISRSEKNFRHQSPEFPSKNYFKKGNQKL